MSLLGFLEFLSSVLFLNSVVSLYCDIFFFINYPEFFSDEITWLSLFKIQRKNQGTGVRIESSISKTINSFLNKSYNTRFSLVGIAAPKCRPQQLS